MKLTDEQLEIERIKFEKYYTAFYSFNDGDMYDMRVGDGYIGEWNATYLGWLACRESNLSDNMYGKLKRWIHMDQSL